MLEVLHCAVANSEDPRKKKMLSHDHLLQYLMHLSYFIKCNLVI